MKPSEFKVNEAWIFFQLNKAPILVGPGGKMNCFGLMDAASLFMLHADFVPVGETISSGWINSLLKKGWTHKKVFPAKLLVSADLATEGLRAAAASENISVVDVPAGDLMIFTKEAQDGFRKQFG